MRSSGQSKHDRWNWLARLRATLLGLQCKATVLVVGLLLLVASVLCGSSVKQTRLLVGRLEREQAVQHAITASKLSASPLRHGDFAEVTRLVNDLVTGNPLWFIQVTDASGNVVASAEVIPGLISNESVHPAGRQLVGTPMHGELPGNRGQYLDVWYPINWFAHTTVDAGPGPPELLGYVRLGVNRDLTLLEFNAAADLLIGMAIAIVVFSVPLAFLVVRRIVVPLNAMSQTAQRFARGDLGVRTTVKRSDEIGLLAKDLNAMADEVERKHREIVTLNEELEERVVERTAQLRELAVREPLTGLYNRRHFSEVLARRFSEAKRYGNELAIMMIDVDDFKGVNDELGHQAGDELLILASLIISSQLRAADVAARFGGDEFIILLPQSNGEQARSLGDRFVTRFNRESRERFPAARATLSVGIASLSEIGAETDEEFVQAADRALYDAKAAGKDRIVMAAASLQ